MARVRAVSFPRSFEVLSSPLVSSLQLSMANSSLAQHFGREERGSKEETGRQKGEEGLVRG